MFCLSVCLFLSVLTEVLSTGPKGGSGRITLSCFEVVRFGPLLKSVNLRARGGRWTGVVDLSEPEALSLTWWWWSFGRPEFTPL